MIIEEIPPSRGWAVHAVYENAAYGEKYLAALNANAKDSDNPGSSDVGIKNLLFAHILSLRPRNVLEIGTLIGSATLIMAQALKLNEFGKLYTVEPNERARKKAASYIESCGLSPWVEFVGGFSSDRHVQDHLKSKGPFDIIFIDAAHDYNAVKDEIGWTWSLLAENGLIFFHDSGQYAVQFDTTSKGGVRRAIFEAWDAFPDFKLVSYEWPLWLNPCGAAISWKRGRRQPQVPK